MMPQAAAATTFSTHCPAVANATPSRHTPHAADAAFRVATSTAAEETHAFVWRKVRRDEEISPAGITASIATLQEVKTSQYVAAPARTLFLSAEKTKTFWIAKVIHPKFEAGLPAKLRSARVEDADQVVCPRLNRDPHGLAKEALQNHASGIVHVATHHIQTARSSRHPYRLISRKEVMRGDSGCDLIFEGAHIRLAFNRR